MGRGELDYSPERRQRRQEEEFFSGKNKVHIILIRKVSLLATFICSYICQEGEYTYFYAVRTYIYL